MPGSGSTRFPLCLPAGQCRGGRHLGPSAATVLHGHPRGDRGGGRFDLYDTLDHSLDYRIRVRNKSDSVGPAYGVLRVAVIAPAKHVFSIHAEANTCAIRKPALNPVQGGSVVSWDDKLLLFRDWMNPGLAVDRYDPASDAWSRAAVLPEDWIVLAVHRIANRIPGGRFPRLPVGRSGFHARL